MVKVLNDNEPSRCRGGHLVATGVSLWEAKATRAKPPQGAASGLVSSRVSSAAPCGGSFHPGFHDPRADGPVEETATSTFSRAPRTSSRAPKGPNVTSRRRKPTGRRRPTEVLFLDGRPARTGPVARRERVVVPGSRSVGLRLRLLTWRPYGASRPQVFQQALTPEAPSCRPRRGLGSGCARLPPRAASIASRKFVSKRAKCLIREPHVQRASSTQVMGSCTYVSCFRDVIRAGCRKKWPHPDRAAMRAGGPPSAGKPDSG